MGQEEKVFMTDCKIRRVPEDPATRKQVKEVEEVTVADTCLGGNREGDCDLP